MVNQQILIVLHVPQKSPSNPGKHSQNTFVSEREVQSAPFKQGFGSQGFTKIKARTLNLLPKNLKIFLECEIWSIPLDDRFGTGCCFFLVERKKRCRLQGALISNLSPDQYRLAAIQTINFCKLAIAKPHPFLFYLLRMKSWCVANLIVI